MKRFFSLLLLVSLLSGGAVHAEDDLEFKVCAALLPCDGEGGVFPEFRVGACAPVYEEQCSEIRRSSAASAGERKFSQCKISNKRKDQQIRRLKQQLRAARRVAE